MLSRLVVGLVALALGCQKVAPAAPDAGLVDVPVTRLLLADGEVLLNGPVVLAEPVRPTSHARAPRTVPCGGMDRSTGLLMPCFDNAPSTHHRHHATASNRRVRCGHTDPETGLIIPCFH